MENCNSFALFDRDGRLVDWDSGFESEWAFARKVLTDGVTYADLLRCATADTDAVGFLQANFQVVADAAVEERIATFGQARSVQLRTPTGRILLVEETPTVHGGIRRVCRDITDAHEAEHALTTAQHQLRAADKELEGARAEIRRNPDGSYVFPPISDALRQMLSLPPEVSGMDPMLVHTRMLHSPEDDAQFETMLEQSAQTLKVCTLEYRVRDGLGRIRWLRQSLLPRRDHDGSTIFSGVIRDVTKERETEDQVELLRSVVIRSGDAIVIFETRPPPGRETKILYVNPKFEELFEVVGGEVIGKPAEALQLDEMSRASARQIADALSRNDGSPIEFEARGKGGRLFWVECRAEIVQRFEDETHRWVVISRDISERRRAQLELLRAKEAAEAGNRAKSAFLANMSHELRTPLNAIIGFTELIQEGVARRGWTDAYCEYLSDIHQSGRHLLDVINTILDLSKIEAGSVVLDLGTVDVPALIRSSMDLVAGLADGGKIALKAELPEGELHLIGDYLKLKQVLLNLLSNAIKFTPQLGEVTVGAICRDRDVVISVRDTGCGISKADIDRVLLPFVQAENTLARRYSGSGLGLAIARQFCLLHGGDLVIDSDEGKGTTVSIVLPRDGRAGSYEPARENQQTGGGH